MKPNNKISIHDFYFCYNPKAVKYLRYEKGIEFILKAVHPSTNKLFYMFAKDESLNIAIDEYNKKSKSDQV